MTENTKITVAYGDGIGPEIMEATLRILKDAGAKIHIEAVEVGAEVYKRENTTGISTSAWDSIRTTKIMLKSPITTPQGGGYKSLNVTFRKTLGLYVNLRPCIAYAPYISTLHPDLDVIIVRENEEDLYFAQGFIVARDRLWQLDFQTRFAAGRLSEVIGEKAIDLDKYNRRMGMGFGARNMEAFVKKDRQLEI